VGVRVIVSLPLGVREIVGVRLIVGVGVIVSLPLGVFEIVGVSEIVGVRLIVGVREGVLDITGVNVMVGVKLGIVVIVEVGEIVISYTNVVTRSESGAGVFRTSRAC
jgi:hypothetical protein